MLCISQLTLDINIQFWAWDRLHIQTFSGQSKLSHVFLSGWTVHVEIRNLKKEYKENQEQKASKNNSIFYTKVNLLQAIISFLTTSSVLFLKAGPLLGVLEGIEVKS